MPTGRVADKPTLDAVNTKIGASTDTANSTGNTIFSIIKAVSSGGGIIKRIQRGVTPALGTSRYMEVTISRLDLNKSILITNSFAPGNYDSSIAGYRATPAGHTAAFTSETSFKITGFEGTIVSWQVVEFN